MSSQNDTQDPKKGAPRLSRRTFLRAQGVGLAVGAGFFFLADDSLLLSLVVGIAWGLGVLASDWQRRKIKALEGTVARYHNALRQYAGLNSDLGDAARKALNNE